MRVSAVEHGNKQHVLAVDLQVPKWHYCVHTCGANQRSAAITCSGGSCGTAAGETIGLCGAGAEAGAPCVTRVVCAVMSCVLWFVQQSTQSSATTVALMILTHAHSPQWCQSPDLRRRTVAVPAPA
jgi:hypothetical protein